MSETKATERASRLYPEPENARSLRSVGEQPGDVEDREGEPFVGPAARILDEALSSTGIDPTSVNVTNAVKHFKWKPKFRASVERGKLHDAPLAPRVVATVHPSSILRAPDDESRLTEMVPASTRATA